MHRNYIHVIFIFILSYTDISKSHTTDLIMDYALEKRHIWDTFEFSHIAWTNVESWAAFDFLFDVKKQRSIQYKDWKNSTPGVMDIGRSMEFNSRTCAVETINGREE